MKDKHLEIDPSQSVINTHHPLTPFFKPKNIAVIGAKDEIQSVAGTLLANLVKGKFSGKIYPINPKRETVQGLKAYSSVEHVPDQIDLAVIITPAKTVPALIKECSEAGIKAVIIISAGFKEMGKPGEELEKQILEYAAKTSLRIIGPNCLGVMNPMHHVNATFAADMALKGHMAFISQSGAMCTAVLDWSLQEKIGFSAFVSIGSMADVDWGDLIDYLGNDPDTHSILIYMETIGCARSFLSAARKVALTKPIIVIKAGRTEAAASAAASHTGSLAGSDEIFEAALERVGVLRVSQIGDLFDMAAALAKQPIPKGPHLTIITNAGGPGVLATDAVVLSGAEMTKIEQKTIDNLSKFLPAAWSHSNPVDVLGDAGPDHYAKAIEEIAKDPNTDGILVILSPQSVTEPLSTAEKIIPYAKLDGKPILTSWMGGKSVQEGANLLNTHGIPSFAYPDTAAAVFATMWHYSQGLQRLYETPTLRPRKAHDAPEREKVSSIIQGAIQEKRALLTEFESKQVLLAYGIPIVETHIATSREEAGQIADQIGYPIVVKLHSETITHKTDVGGVKLSLQNKAAVCQAYDDILASVTRLKGKEHFQGVTVQKMISRDGYEIILGSIIDVQFGPVVLFGSGGELVEVLEDKALALPPLTNTLARQLMQKTKIFKALQGVRGKPAVDLDRLEEILVNFSQLIVEQTWIKELDINPIMISHNQMIALDARIVLHEPTQEPATFTQTAIRPYPYQYEKKWTAKNGQQLLLRPIRAEDEPLIVNFHKELSENTVRQRYLELLSLDTRIAHKRLIQVCCVDYEKELTFVAEHQGEILGVLALQRLSLGKTAEFKMIIVDKFQGHGLGRAFLQLALEVCKKEGIQELVAEVLEENHVLIHLLQKMNFTLSRSEKNPRLIVAKH